MKNFLLPFTIYSIVLMSLSYGLIVAVDPYDKLGINLFGFETKAVASSRENKYYMLERSAEKYEAFILGSSTAHRYETSDIERVTGFKAFNYAVQHATPEDYIAITNHIRSKFKPKLIIIQIAFVDLDKTYLTDKRLSVSPLSKFIEDSGSTNAYVNSDVFSNQLLTLDALMDSFRVIFVNLFGEARHVYAKHGNYRTEKPVVGPIEVVQFSHQNWVLDLKRVEKLKLLQAELKKSGIKLVIISAPLAPAHLSRIMKSEYMDKAFKQYKKTIFSTFDIVHDFSNSRMNKYNTTEYFRNSTHPSKKLSKQILETVWSKNE